MTSEIEEQAKITAALWQELDGNPEGWADELDASGEYPGWEATPDIMGRYMDRIYRIGDFAVARFDAVFVMLHSETYDYDSREGVDNKTFQLAAILERSEEGVWEIIKMAPLGTP